ncbi:Polyketide cyclase / dehydrase and lipid transport [Quadrisphaera granulorum]|uniref:Polyketide cyclase/dehydrase/lipid transport protein n=1 Tax=Quadrisphaera granulorum TaxID=317664 RepID=A0A316AH20_9ACTN|nr:SRPBCC family protein [Quadrisphaera granulorum]PWJ56184.1 polyketide cyclase/dehydrase/lipid transport protein [Quadrisphaera granulorum]SZE94818.1 Polyketide cyclase / dehydrase and lipid transport [Quadrisphaera granulorum]
MARFTAHREVAAPADVVWELVTDWSRHGDWIPLTTMTVEHDTGGVGTRFVGRSGIGRAAFDDPMEVTSWEPPTPTRAGTAAIEHRGRLVLGHAEVQVVPLPGGRSRLRWTEDISFVNKKLSRAVTLPIAVGGWLAFGNTLKKVAAEAEARASR